MGNLTTKNDMKNPRQVAKIGRIWDPEKFVGERTFTTEEVLDTRERLDSIISHLLD